MQVGFSNPVEDLQCGRNHINRAAACFRLRMFHHFNVIMPLAVLCLRILLLFHMVNMQIAFFKFFHLIEIHSCIFKIFPLPISFLKFPFVQPIYNIYN